MLKKEVACEVEDVVDKAEREAGVRAGAEMCGGVVKDEEDGWGWIGQDSMQDSRIQELLMRINQLEMEKSRLSGDLKAAQVNTFFKFHWL